jgi:hypothetical protein
MVVRDESVAEDSYPWAVELWNTATGAFDCSGAAISPDWVLTARHCVEKDTADILYVSGGKPVMMGSDRQSVKKIYTHPSRDLALLYLQKPLVLHRYGVPAVNRTFGSDSSSGKQIGWGCPSGPIGMMCIPGENGTGALIPSIRTVNIWDKGGNGSDACDVSGTLSSGAKIDFGGICLSPKGIKGDSGGPVIYKSTIVGILSMIYIDRNLAADVSQAFNWIRANTGTVPYEMLYRTQPVIVR